MRPEEQPTPRPIGRWYRMLRRPRASRKCHYCLRGPRPREWAGHWWRFPEGHARASLVACHECMRRVNPKTLEAHGHKSTG